MTLKIYNPELELRFREYVGQRESNNIKIINEMLEAVFALERHLDSDVLGNLIELGQLIKALDWDALHGVHADLKSNVLTQNATLANLVAAMVQEGVNHRRLGQRSAIAMSKVG